MFEIRRTGRGVVHLIIHDSHIDKLAESEVLNTDILDENITYCVIITGVDGYTVLVIHLRLSVTKDIDVANCQIR